PLPVLVLAADLPPEEEEWTILRAYAYLVARRWRLFGAQAAALENVSPTAGDSREVTRQWLAWKGVCLALAQSRTPTKVKVGKGHGSGSVRDARGRTAKIIPADQDEIAFLGWLAQAAPKRAAEYLQKLAAEFPAADGFDNPQEVDQWPA